MSSALTNFTYQNVLDTASKLGHSQGSWGRYAEELRKLTPEQIEAYNNTLEVEGIADEIDFILYVESGVSPADIEQLKADLEADADEGDDDDDDELAINLQDGGKGVVIRSEYAPYPEGLIFEATHSNRSTYGTPEDGDDVLGRVMSRHHTPGGPLGDRQPTYEIEGHMTLAHGLKGTWRDSVERWAKIFDETILKVVWHREPTSSKGYYFEAAVAIRQKDLDTLGVDLEAAAEVACGEMKQVAAWFDGCTFELIERTPEDEGSVYSYIYGTDALEELLKDAGYDRSEVHDLTLKALTLEA